MTDNNNQNESTTSGTAAAGPHSFRKSDLEEISSNSKQSLLFSLQDLRRATENAIAEIERTNRKHSITAAAKRTEWEQINKKRLVWDRLSDSLEEAKEGVSVFLTMAAALEHLTQAAKERLKTETKD